MTQPEPPLAAPAARISRSRWVLMGLIAATLALFACSGRDAPMKLTGLDPDFGPLEGGQTVAIKGSGLRLDIGYSVHFGKRPSPRVSMADTGTLLAVTPDHPVPGAVDVLIRADNGAAFQLKGAFTYKDQSGNLLRDMGKTP